MNVSGKERFSRGVVWLALLCAFGLAPASAFAQEEEVLQEEDTEKSKLEKGEEATKAIQDGLVGPDAFTNPKVKQDSNREYPEPVKKFGKNSEIRWNLSLSGRFLSRDNLNFRATDDSSQQAIIDSDDRVTFGATQMVAGLKLKINDKAGVGLSFVNNALWGSGAISDLARDNSIVFTNVYLDFNLVDMPGFKLDTKIGRQFFSIGGAPRDYFFRDVVDGVTINADFGIGGKLRILGVDVVGSQTRPDEVDFFTRQESESSNVNFDGQTNTYRTGLVYENTKLVQGLELRAFGFYADVGAGDIRTSSGVDVTYGGKLGNFADNDYSLMFGGRVGYFFKTDTLKVGGYGEFARSAGIDRKATVYGLNDVDTSGNAFGGGVMADVKFGKIGLDFNASFFRADGPVYGNDGILGQSGFVSMKGNHIGGLAMDDTAGWHPSAYVASSKGLEVDPQEQQRKSGTQAIHAQVGFGLIDTLRLSLEVWHFTDVGFTFLKEEDVPTDAQDLPFGYSQADLDAQQRLGKTLGTELGGGLTYLASDLISVYAQGAIFLPGDFYQGEITRSGGSALGSNDPQNTWVVLLGTTLEWK